VLACAKGLDPNAGIFFYLDDGYLVASAAVIEAVLLHLRAVFAEVGVELDEKKCQAWASDASALPESLRPFYVPEMKILGRVLSIPGDGEHQGLPTRPSAQTLDREIERLQALNNDLLDLVKHGLDLQTATALLRAYAGPASQYTLSTSELSSEEATKYDAAIA